MKRRYGKSLDKPGKLWLSPMIKETDGDCFENMRSLEQNLTFRSAAAQFAKRNVPFDEIRIRTLGFGKP